eukprot:22472-Eustigmatos_ZCMA.PRE.1
MPAHTHGTDMYAGCAGIIVWPTPLHAGYGHCAMMPLTWSSLVFVDPSARYTSPCYEEEGRDQGVLVKFEGTSRPLGLMLYDTWP